MLKRFGVGNVLSFGEHTVFFDLEERLTAVVGNSAFGKTNLVRAMRMMRDIVLTSDTYPYKGDCCGIDYKNGKEPSYFGAMAEVNGVSYIYEFEAVLERNIFISEQLKIKRSTDDDYVSVFKRGLTEIIFNEDLIKGSLKRKLKSYYKDTGPRLFLQYVNDGKSLFEYRLDGAQPFIDIFNWFRDSLVVIRPDDACMLYRIPNMDVLLDCVSSFDAGIDGLDYSEKLWNDVKYSLPEEQRRSVFETIKYTYPEADEDSLFTYHPVYFLLKGLDALYVVKIEHDEMYVAHGLKCETYMEIRFKHGSLLASPEKESKSIRHLVCMLEPILSDAEKTFIIDDFDIGFDSRRRRRYIEAYLNDNKHGQLVITCREESCQSVTENEKRYVIKSPEGYSEIYDSRNPHADEA